MKTMNCAQFKEMLVSGCNNLENRHEEINTLNVFPVPDGDTGTNMLMTFNSGVNEVSKLLNEHVGDTAKVLGKGMLMGARGNSGVILSQIFKGVYKAFDSLQTVTAADFARGFANGSRVAYKAVMRPVEGTILTVVREASEKGSQYMEEHPDADIKEFFEVFYNESAESLKRTPELLPILKEAGVVDSGGAGFKVILEGFVAYLQGKPVTKASQEEKSEPQGYCVELTIDLNDYYKKEFNEEKLVNSLSRTCEVANVSRDGDVVKLHVHSFKPGDILTTCLRFGEYHTVKIENMRYEVHHTLDFADKKKELEEFAIITVCNGEGIKEAFKGLGAHYFVNGGQTMNPSTEDFISLIKTINAKHIYILPNNSNIIMAANQAVSMLKRKDITVIATTTIPEGLSACMAFNPDVSSEEAIEMMKEAASLVKTGSVTHAVKDTSFNGVQVTEGDYIGIAKKEIIASQTDFMEVSKKLISHLMDEESSFVTLITGKETTPEEAKELEEYLNSEFDVDCQLIDGQQEIYALIVGVE